MNEPRRGEVITFYSYKGGVGRSAAVANVATLLAQRGKKVLAIDFDLEAPGLHRYWGSLPGGNASKGAQQGTVEFFAALRASFQRCAPAEAEGEDACLSEENETRLRDEVGKLLDSDHYVRSVEVDDPNREGARAALFLMHAGSFDSGYPERVRAFPWSEFYDEYPFFAELLADELGKRYDYVLIDSRTGTTDVGNLCTVLLPEKLVVVFTPNEQSLHGALEVGQQAVELRKASQDVRPLPLFPLMSRVENAENELQRRWIALSRQRFEQVFHVVYGVNKSLSAYFDLVQIPHRSFYAYGETIAATRERSTEVHSLAGAFRVFVDAVTCNNAIEAQGAIRRRWEAASGTPLGAPQSDAAPFLPPPVDPPSTIPDSEASGLVATHQPPSVAPFLRSSRWGLWGVALASLAIALAWLSVRTRGVKGDVGASAQPASPPLSLEGVSAPSTTAWSPRPVEIEAFPAVPAPSPPAAPTSRGNAPRPALLPPNVDQTLVTALRLRARAQARGGQQTTAGKPVFNFEVWVEGPNDAVERIESVDYFFDHPSFQVKHFTSSVGPDFLRGYAGWGCISTVQVTITWKSGSKSLLPFDQCAAL